MCELTLGEWKFQAARFEGKKLVHNEHEYYISGERLLQKSLLRGKVTFGITFDLGTYCHTCSKVRKK